MYTTYKNFQLKKEKDFVKISVDSFIELEKIEDEWLISYKFPEFLEGLIKTKFPIKKYDVYNIYTVNVVNYNRISDYKKIWKLGGFEANGLYDNYYEGKNGRIYFGIIKGYTQFKCSVLMGNITIFISKEDSLPTEKIFNLFAKNQYDISLNKEKHILVLPDLQKLIKNSIVVHKIHADNISLNIYGNNIEQNFDMSDLPLSDVIEK